MFNANAMHHKSQPKSAKAKSITACVFIAAGVGVYCYQMFVLLYSLSSRSGEAELDKTLWIDPRQGPAVALKDELGNCVVLTKPLPDSFSPPFIAEELAEAIVKAAGFSIGDINDCPGPRDEYMIFGQHQHYSGLYIAAQNIAKIGRRSARVKLFHTLQELNYHLIEERERVVLHPFFVSGESSTWHGNIANNGKDIWGCFFVIPFPSTNGSAGDDSWKENGAELIQFIEENQLVHHDISLRKCIADEHIPTRAIAFENDGSGVLVLYRLLSINKRLGRNTAQEFEDWFKKQLNKMGYETNLKDPVCLPY